MTNPCAPNAARFAPLGPEAAAAWAGFPASDRELFAHHVDLVAEEIRQDYARLRLRYGPHLTQTVGVVHGGAIATLIDTVVVPAVGWPYERDRAVYSTINLHVDYLRPVVKTDLIAEGWVERRGRSVVFCRAEARRASDGELAATGVLTYAVRRVDPEV